MNKAVIATFLTLMTALSGVTYLAMNSDSKNLRTATDDIKASWHKWVITYGKSYSEAELPLKFATFSSNYKWVEKFNK